MTKLIAIYVATLALTLPAAAWAGDDCAVPCTMEQWRVNYCRALAGTNEVAAQSCLKKEQGVLFRSDCTAKLHYKREMCELSNSGASTKSVEDCVNDSLFKGQMVRSGGA